MKKQVIFATVTLLMACLTAVVFAQEQLCITFDPPLVPGGVKAIDDWVEQDVRFTGPQGFSQYDSGREMCPDNGTAYLHFASGPRQTLVFRFLNPAPFKLISVGLAEYSTLFQNPKTITFVGHKTNGATVTGGFIVDGVIDGTGPLADFETFTFGEEFSNLSYVEVPTTGYSMDNLVIDPGPGSTRLVGLKITGPEEVVEGSLVQYKTIVSYGNGFTLNVTTSTIWSVEPEMYGYIDENGFLRTENINEPLGITIYAEYTEGPVTLETEMAVQVLPSRTLYVPSAYETIQAAIEVARGGDVVIVADGTYTGEGNCDIDFGGKAITLSSENGPENCIIDCNGTEDEPHRGFYFHSGETASSVVNGLTILNGYSPLMQYQAGSRTYNYWAGGAIFCYQSGPTISNCHLIDNYAYWFGGAISCWGSNCIITECTIRNNVANSGGGIHCRGYSTPVISNCVITNNRAHGGNIGLGANSGGGIYSHADAIIVSCVITGNVAAAGGGIYADGDNFGGGYLKITNSIFSANIATRAGAIACGELSRPSIVNCILWDDDATYGPEIAMCPIDWGSTLSISYTDIEGGKASIANASAPGCHLDWGPGNINADPCFVEPGYWDANGVWIGGDYHLLSDSPCINAGDPNYMAEPNETDLDGRPRVLLGRIDMGAYEFNHVPVADAGPDQTVYAWIDGIAEVTLDGTGSYDDDGQPLTYLWRWAINGQTYDVNGVTATIELPVGEQTVELIVNDGIDDSEPDEVVITVIPPMQSHLWLVPRVINRHSRQPKILAMLRLPEGVTRDQVDSDQPLLLYPGGIEAMSQRIIESRRQEASIFAFFDKAELMDAVSDNGSVELRVGGQLKTGQYFCGTDTVRIISPRNDNNGNGRPRRRGNRR